MKKVDLIVSGKYLLTMDNDLKVLKNGAIAINDSKILAVDELMIIKKEFEADEVINAKNSIVLPGMINTHTHVAMSYFRGLADDLGLDEWLNKHIWPAEAKNVNCEFVKKSSELGCLEMIKSGVTCFNDMYFFEEETAKVAKGFGMRAIIGEGILDFPTPSCVNPEKALAASLSQIEKYKNDDLISVAFAPHSIYTCNRELLIKIKKLADENNVNIHIHLAETKKELDECQQQFGKTPVQYLDEIGFLGSNVIAVHSVWLDKIDLRILKEKQVKISHNPISNMKLSSGTAPILEALQKHKIVVGLGTDSAASNNTQDLFTDMRAAALIHKISNEGPIALSAEDIVKMATIDGAKVLGMEKKIGSLEVGKQADIITINLDKPHLQPIYNPYSHLVYCANAEDANDVIIGGKLVMRERKVINVNEAEIVAAAKNFKLS